MANYYCKNCGTKYSSISTMTINKCARHPNGTNKGSHELYEGSEKSRYECKYCGTKYNSISSMTVNRCARHPNGTNKGQHSPAL
ncbi:hypothetical protein DSM00_2763 [Leeuwenhoekiella aequorea]|uniref:C2H2-type domain-containing protein n=1 Tax=Leeuwenhoekiella aequorea TaxID=283736 RepID=A0A4Q0P4Y8_9FLAO|nr:hypothetical protein DSM00_2763 [Leeuwenhoekiella aequorea]